MTKKHPKLSKTAKLFWFSVGSIIYTYLGYPLLITLLARFKTKNNDYPDTIPIVTLLIAAYNEEDVIEEKILNSLSLDYPKEFLQIMIVADGSYDSTPEIVEKYSQSRVELLFEPERRGKMAAINRAIPYVRGDIIIFSDANNLYQPQTIRELVAPFSDPEIGAVSGAKTVVEGDSNVGASEGLYWKYEAFIKEQESRLSSCTSVAGEIWAVRRGIYQSPPDNIINDDFYMAMQVLKQGYRITYVPTARSIERASSSAKGEMTRRKRIIAGRYQAIFKASEILPVNQPILVWQIISHKFLRPMVPFFMLGVFFTNLKAFFKSGSNNVKNGFWNLSQPFNYIFLALQVIFYGLAWIGRYQETTENGGKLERLLYLPTFLFNSNLAAFQGFLQYIKGEQSHIWERVSRN